MRAVCNRPGMRFAPSGLRLLLLYSTLSFRDVARKIFHMICYRMGFPHCVQNLSSA